MKITGRSAVALVECFFALIITFIIVGSVTVAAIKIVKICQRMSAEEKQALIDQMQATNAVVLTNFPGQVHNVSAIEPATNSHYVAVETSSGGNWTEAARFDVNGGSTVLTFTQSVGFFRIVSQ